VWNGGSGQLPGGRSRSRPEFIARLGIVVEEADETMFWLGMLADADICEKR